MDSQRVTVIGAGLAGCEAAWQLAEAGVHVRLLEMKQRQRTPAQISDRLAELVCSNSLRSNNVLNAVGLLKQEMRQLRSLIIECATEARVPAGDALAVDRVRFADAVTQAMHNHQRIEVVSEIVTRLPLATEGPAIVATGPLTGSELAADIALVTGDERLFFYDAIAPIVSGDSIDRSIAFCASRYGKGEGADYLNCPLSREDYEAFIDAVLAAESMPLHDFEDPRYFEGCLPLEVTAGRGRETLRFGCMKPVGLTDPRTGHRPYAVVQLRKEDVYGQAYNLVGFQTKLKYPDQKRVLAMIPGLRDASFLRMGAIHRNTYIDAPAVLDDTMGLKARPNVRFAGQITGVEGYVESAAHGLITALMLSRELRDTSIAPPPPQTALGALLTHTRGTLRLPGRPHEPQNVNWGLFPPVTGVKKKQIKAARVAVANDALRAWALDNQVELTEPDQAGLRPSGVALSDGWGGGSPSTGSPSP